MGTAVAVAELGQDDLTESKDIPESLQLAYQQIEEWRHDEFQYLGWRYDASLAAQYYDGNQYSADDRAAMADAGVPMITNNRISRQINDVVGLQASQMTDWMLKSENPGGDDALLALQSKLKTAQRLTKANRARLKAFASQIKAGIGWIEVGYERNPFKFPYSVKECPWREMWWDRNAPEADLEEGAYVRRSKWYRKDLLQSMWPEKAGMIEWVRTMSDPNRQFVEPQQLYRSFNTQTWRDPPKTWAQNGQMMKNYRSLDEIWYQVQVEGPVVFLPNGRVMAYDKCGCNPMVQLALKSGMAEIRERVPYSRWRRAFWVEDIRLEDSWSPFPFSGPPYVPFFGYREDDTGVPYGLSRTLMSLQDTTNTLEGKIMFSMSAVRVKVREGSVLNMDQLRREVGNKRAMIIIRENAEMEDVQIDEHLALNEQHIRVLEDTKRSMDEVTGTAGLNPASMTEGKPRSAAQINAMMLRAMATLGEIQDNFMDASTVVGTKLSDMVREGIEAKGDVPVEIRLPHGAKKRVILHQKAGEHDGHDVISNDVTLFHAEVVLDEVPHTATFQAQMYEKLSEIVQTLPPEAVDIRRVMLPELVEVSGLPGAEEKAQMLRETTGLAPPSTPEAQAAAQQQAEMQQQERDIMLQTALAQVDKTKAQAMKLQSDAQKSQVEAQKIAQEGQTPADQDKALLDREQHAAKVINIRSKTAKALAETRAIENETPPPKPALPTRW